VVAVRTLVTGGLGFMGSNFVHHLVSKGEEVTILDALTYAGRRENVKGIEGEVDLVIGDLRDQRAVEEVVARCDYVCHFGAETHIDRSIADPRPFVETNVMGTFNLLEAARRHGVEKFVLISSSEIYGTALRAPMDEEHPLNPQSPYAATKAAADRMCSAYHETYGAPVMVVRAFNNYGPRQFPEKLIPFFTLRALHDLPLPVYGDGKYSRDYLYVEDFCRGVEGARSARAEGEAINLATGRDLMVVDIARMILERLGKPLSLITHVEDRPGHVRRLIGSNKKAEALLGWRPSTAFEEGLPKTIDWYLGNEWWWRPLRGRFAMPLEKAP